VARRGSAWGDSERAWLDGEDRRCCDALSRTSRVHCVRRREPAGSKVAAPTRRDLASPYSGIGAGRKHTRGSARQCSEARCRMWLWGLACVKPKRAHQEEKAPASCRGLRLVVVPSRLGSCRSKSLVASAGRTPRVRGRDIEWRRDRENRDRARVGGTYGTRNNKRVSPRPTCRAHVGRGGRTLGPRGTGRRSAAAETVIEKSGSTERRTLDWSCFTQFPPLTKEVSVSFRVSHNATSVFASRST